MVQYPRHYHAEAVAHAGTDETWETVASEHKTECSIPEAYEGTGEAFSPEDFFLLSLQNCFVATFKVYAEHLKLDYESIKVSADLIVDIEQDKGPVMKRVEMNIDLYGVIDEMKAENFVNKALEDGFIFNSVITDVEPRITFHEGAA